MKPRVTFVAGMSGVGKNFALEMIKAKDNRTWIYLGVEEPVMVGGAEFGRFKIKIGRNSKL